MISKTLALLAHRPYPLTCSQPRLLLLSLLERLTVLPPASELGVIWRESCSLSLFLYISVQMSSPRKPYHNQAIWKGPLHHTLIIYPNFNFYSQQLSINDIMFNICFFLWAFYIVNCIRVGTLQVFWSQLSTSAWNGVRSGKNAEVHLTYLMNRWVNEQSLYPYVCYKLYYTVYCVVGPL